MVKCDKQAGGMLLEIMLTLTLLLLMSTMAVPQAAKLYRQVVVEYEAEQLLSAIRYCQNRSRVTAESAWNYGAKLPNRHYVFLKFFPDHNQIMSGTRDVIESHTYLYGVNVAKIYQEKGKTQYDDSVELVFNANGKPKAGDMMTLLIYYQGYPQDGQRIMVSKGGRIRMERGGIAGG